MVKGGTDMKVCKQCGQAVQDVETYCPRCGSGQLIADTTQRTQQRIQQPQQRVNQDQSRTGAPSQARQPQQAPPGYRNPNSIPQQRQVQRPPQSQQGRPQQRPQQVQTAQGQQRQAQPQYQNQQRASQNQQMQQDDYGFAPDMEQAHVKEKKKFGFGKKSKADKVQQPQAVQQQAPVNQGQGAYSTPPYSTQNGAGIVTDETVTLKEWFIMMLKLLIPIYNIIFIIGAWKGNNVKPSMQNYIKMYTILLGVGLLIGVLFWVALVPLITSLMW